MKVKVEKNKTNLTSFDEKLRSLICSAQGLPVSERIRLHKGIKKICEEQVGDCIDGFTMSMIIALHDDHGFGEQRINKLISRTEDIVVEAVDRYDIGTAYGLRNMLKARGINYTLKVEK